MDATNMMKPDLVSMIHSAPKALSIPKWKDFA